MILSRSCFAAFVQPSLFTTSRPPNACTPAALRPATFRCVRVSRALAAGTAHQARRHTHVRIARSINSLVFGCRPRPPARAVGGALGGSYRPCDVGGILRCIPMPFAIAARPRPPVRHERKPLSRRVMMAAAGRYTPRGRPVEARPHDMSVCHATRHQVRVRKWSLGARRLSSFVANDQSRPPDTPLGVLRPQAR